MDGSLPPSSMQLMRQVFLYEVIHSSGCNIVLELKSGGQTSVHHLAGRHAGYPLLFPSAQRAPERMCKGCGNRHRINFPSRTVNRRYLSSNLTEFT